MCKTRTIASKNTFFINSSFFSLSPKRVPWRSPRGPGDWDIYGTFRGHLRDLACRPGNTLKKRDAGRLFLKAEPSLQLSRESMRCFFAKLPAIFAKGFFKDVWLGSKYATEKVESFKMKQGLARLSWLLQRIAFLVIIFTLTW